MKAKKIAPFDINNWFESSSKLSMYSLSNLFHTPRKKITKKLIDKNIILISIIFASILGTPLFSNYESKTIFNNFRDLYPEKIAYVESDNWGVREENKMNQNIEFCWINKLCIPPNSTCKRPVTIK